MSTPETPRRTFVVRACQTAAALSVLPVLPACSGSGGSPTSPSGGSAATPLPTLTAAVAGSQATLTIDGGSPLATVGNSAVVRANTTSLLVQRTGQDTFSVLSALCTHEACAITGVRGTTFVCPCHGSQFSASGAVQTGPATRPLTVFTNRFAGGVLTISL